MLRKVAILFVLLFALGYTPVFAAPIAQAEGEGNPWWLWLIVLAVLALFVGFMIWWWLREPEEEVEPATRHAHPEVHEAPPPLKARVGEGETAAAEASVEDTASLAVTEVETVEIEAAPPQVAAIEAAEAHAEPDDLTIVEGIGPAIQKVLYAAEIHTFRQLASTDAQRLEAILKESDPHLARLFNPATWPEQAQLAAEGRWDELESLQARLTAGRRG